MREYKDTHGDIIVTQKGNRIIYQMFAGLRSSYEIYIAKKNGGKTHRTPVYTLTENNITELEELGFNFDISTQLAKPINELRKYKETNGNLIISSTNRKMYALQQRLRSSYESRLQMRRVMDQKCPQIN